MFRDRQTGTEHSLLLRSLAGGVGGAGRGMLSCVLCRPGAVVLEGRVGSFRGFNLHTCWLSSSSFGVSPAEMRTGSLRCSF